MPVAQAGAVAVRVAEKTEFLLARSKQIPENWIFPKGHLEPGEDDEEAALRDLQEETGYTGRILAPVGSIEYARGAAVMRVEYFLVDGVEHIGPGDGREIAWLPYDAARQRLAHDDARRVLDAAMQIIDTSHTAAD